MDRVSTKYANLPLQDPPKITQIWIFGLKTNHLATLFLPTLSTHTRPLSLNNSQFTLSFAVIGRGSRCLFSQLLFDIQNRFLSQMAFLLFI
jgi:hypothetical protein